MFQDFLPALHTDINRMEILLNLQKADPGIGRNDQPQPIPPADAHCIMHLTTQWYNESLAATRHKYIVACQIQLVTSRFFARTFEGVAVEMEVLHRVIVRT